MRSRRSKYIKSLPSWRFPSRLRQIRSRQLSGPQGRLGMCEVAGAAICLHGEASDYQVGWKWYYPHSPWLYGQPPCGDNRCWHDNQRSILLRTLHRLTPLVPRPSTRSLPFTKTLPTTSTSTVTNSPSMRCGISPQPWWLARPTRQRMNYSPYSVSKHYRCHPTRKGKTRKNHSNARTYATISPNLRRETSSSKAQLGITCTAVCTGRHRASDYLIPS